MRIPLTDTNGDGIEIPVLCEVEFDLGEPETNCGSGYRVSWIKYGDVQYENMKDFHADFPDCHDELIGLIEQEELDQLEDRADRKFYGDWEINDER